MAGVHVVTACHVCGHDHLDGGCRCGCPAHVPPGTLVAHGMDLRAAVVDLLLAMASGALTAVAWWRRSGWHRCRRAVKWVGLGVELAGALAWDFLRAYWGLLLVAVILVDFVVVAWAMWP